VRVVEGQLPIERRVNEVLATFPHEVRDGMLDFLTLEDSAERAHWIGRLYSAPQVRGLAELLIDLEIDVAARAFVIGMLRESERS
jgi:hypothetical protein